MFDPENETGLERDIDIIYPSGKTGVDSLGEILALFQNYDFKKTFSSWYCK